MILQRQARNVGTCWMRSWWSSLDEDNSNNNNYTITLLRGECFTECFYWITKGMWGGRGKEGVRMCNLGDDRLAVELELAGTKTLDRQWLESNLTRIRGQLLLDKNTSQTCTDTLMDHELIIWTQFHQPPCNCTCNTVSFISIYTKGHE